ncbi:NrdH-redoxin [Streptomyces sp. CC53]|uniref:glutaredoxin family protein n=1 Tax=unclassified Streptomyces TaxID=2593676 RepID=UPI0008DEA798|nr:MULTISPECIES: glutaredoxin family protein [unclassified Streptomyces]OII61931.1 NrdH-redoxin [Streptomyces sp. CC53]OII69858.1 NrdH-redoxin [Streptomyces sp. CC77]
MFGRTKKKAADRGAGPRTVTLIGKPGCHLCDEARTVVEQVCAETGAVWEEKDITRDEELHRAYWEQIPVVLVDGEQHTFWKVDPARLRRALAS